MTILSENQTSERQLKWAIWFVTHRAELKRGLILFLVLLNLFFWGYSLFGFLDYFVFSFQKERSLERQLVRGGFNWPAIQEINKPLPLEWSSPELIVSAKATDFVVQIRNPNSQWLAKFKYAMSLGDETKTGESFVLPGSNKYLFNSFKGAKGVPSFSIVSLNWQRILSKDVAGDYLTFFSSRLDLAFENIKVSSATRDLPGRLSFEIVNKGAYSFWQTRFIILLFRGDKLLGIESVSLDKFKAGERRRVEINLFDRSGGITKVEIIPDINILDFDNYMPLGETIN
jgi:hypothetical protein